MELGLLALCLLLNGFFSGAETVFLSVNRLRVAGFIRRRKRGSRSIQRFFEKPSRFVMTTLVGNNLLDIAFTSLLTAYLISFGVAEGWIFILSTIMLLVFGDIIPKTFARDFADQVILWVSPLLRFFQLLLFPVIRLCALATMLILRVFGVSSAEVRLFFTRRDLELLIRESFKTGQIGAQKGSLIYRVLQLPTLKATQVMTPRTEIVALSQNATLEDLRQTALRTGFSKIPIYASDVDHIIGVAYAKELFANPKDLAEITKPIAFFPDQKKAVSVFRDLREARQHVAIVVDEWGGTAGIITLEDVIEELTGDIEDEYDPKRLRIREFGKGRWMVSGRIEIEELNQRLGLNLPEGDYETLGGFLIGQLERIPRSGEVIIYEGIEYKTARASLKRVYTVVISKLENAEKE